METISKQGLFLLIQEIQMSLEKLDQSQKEIVNAFQKLSPHLNLKLPSLFENSASQMAWKELKQAIQLYFSFIQRGVAAYQDLSTQMQSVLTGRSSQDPLFQEIARQGNSLSQDLQKRQTFAHYVLELQGVLDRLAQYKKVSPGQKQQIEDCVFRLQLLG